MLDKIFEEGCGWLEDARGSARPRTGRHRSSGARYCGAGHVRAQQRRGERQEGRPVARMIEHGLLRFACCSRHPRT